MNPADNTIPSANKQQPPSVANATIHKEHEIPLASTASEAVSEMTTEVEISPEVEKAGVTAYKETIELPPDIKKLGIAPTGSATPVVTTVVPPVVLPISDDKVVAGLHARLLSSLRWLAVWCIKKLKKAHIILKIIHGKIIRVKKD